MSDEYVPKFEPGEVAVLLNTNGGRLFTVGEVPEQTVEGEHYMVREVPSKYGVGKGLEVSTVWLVKVQSRDDAVALVAVLSHIAESAAQQVRFINQTRDGQLRSAVALYSMEYCT